MKNSKMTMAITFIVLVAQIIILNLSEIEYISLPFSTGLISLENVSGIIVMILTVFFPIPFILYVFFGTSNSLTHGYYRLLIVRNYSRTKLSLKLFKNTIIKLFFIVSISFCLYELFFNETTTLENIVKIKIILSYYFVMINVILLGYILELYLQPQYVNIILNTFFVGSIFLGTFKPSKLLYCIFFPNLGYAYRNGSLESGSASGLLFYESIIVNLFIMCIEAYIFIKIYKKKDIF